MAAGCTIVNRHFRDVRIFRALNAFEPPIYVLFFTLAGPQLHLSALAFAGWLGFMFFWAEQEELTPYVRCQAVATESRQETILTESCRHDLVVMPTSASQGLKRIFFGSLAEGVARECIRPMLIVYNPGSATHLTRKQEQKS